MANPIKGTKDKDGKQKWIAPVRNPQTWRRTTQTVVGFEKAKAAIRESDELVSESRKNTSGELLSVSCKRYLAIIEKRYGSDRLLPGRPETRWASYEDRIYGHVLAYFGEIPTRDIDVHDIYSFFDHLLDDDGGKLSLSSANDVLAAFNQMLKVAKTAQVISVNPIDDFDPFRTAKFLEENRAERPVALTLVEVRLLLEQTNGSDRLIIWCFLLLGLRTAEFIGLRWRHVEDDGVWIFESGAGYTLEGEAKVMRSRTKTHAGARFVPASPKLREELKRARKAIKDYHPDQHVFLSHEGTPFSAHGLLRRVQAIQNGVHGRPRRKYDKERNASNHELRHTCVAIWLAAGISLANIAKWIGHADPSTTIMAYGHLLQDPDLPSI